MFIKILSLIATLATFSAVSAPAFAAGDEMAAPDSATSEAVSPEAAPRCDPRMRDCNDRPQPCQPWMRDCNRPPMRSYQCYARNALGRTFSAYGDWRTPRYYVEQRALDNCRYQSLPFIRATCRMIGCR